MTGILLQDNSVLYKGQVMTVTVHHVNDTDSTYRNVIKVDCDGIVVAIHFYNLEHEVESAFYDLGYTTEHSKDAITSYEVNV